MKLVAILFLSLSAFAKEGDVLLSCENIQHSTIEATRTDLTGQISVRYKKSSDPKNPTYYAQGEEAIENGVLVLGVVNGKKIEFVQGGNKKSWNLHDPQNVAAVPEFKCK